MFGLWFPHKIHLKKKSLLDYEHRIEMVRRAVDGYDKMSILDVEYGYFPSYTIHTLYNIEKKSYKSIFYSFRKRFIFFFKKMEKL